MGDMFICRLPKFMVVYLALVSCLLSPEPGQTAPPAGSPADLAVVTEVTYTRYATHDLLAVTADRPLVYSFYRLTNPPRVILDLALTVPGAYTEPLAYSGGRIKQVRFIRRDQSSGLLTRMECLLADGADFSVTRSKEDERKVLLTVANAAPKPIFAELTAVSTSVKPRLQPVEGAPGNAGTPQKSDGAAPQPLLPPVAKHDPPPVSKNSVSPATTSQTLTAIVATPEGIDIITTGPIKTYNSFMMTKPDRLVIDLDGVRNGISVDRVEVAAYGITGVRLGSHDGKCRIVLHGAPEALQRIKLFKIGNGLRLTPAGAGIPATKPK